jgi:hypothetical protein
MLQTNLAAIGACALLAIATPARAQTPDPPNRFLHPTEIAPFVTSGGDSNGIGASVRWPMTSRLSIQAEGEYRYGESDPVWNLPISRGGNANLLLVVDGPRAWRITPFVVGGGGLEHRVGIDHSRPFTGPVTLSGGNSFVVNGGGGVRVALSDRVAARVEIRYADGWADGARDSVRFLYGTTVGFGPR